MQLGGGGGVWRVSTGRGMEDCGSLVILLRACEVQGIEW